MSDAHSPPDTRPLVLTLAFAPHDQERFDALRRQHFPAERNHLDAHLTLFHALPGDHAAAVTGLVREEAGTSAFGAEVEGVRSLGRGVALSLRSPEASALHARLLRRFETAYGDRLTRQDQQRLRPHVTVANKLEPQRARALHDELAATFQPWTARATGLVLWRYAGGPWEHHVTVPLTTVAGRS